jgi:methyltransferase
VRRVLEYLETPQYLRKRVFPLDESLKFAGLLPPLRIPSHKPKVPVASLHAGELREGFVLEDGRSVDVGLDSSLALDREAAPLKRVTVRITSVTPLRGVLGDRSTSREYWGYSVEEGSAEEVLSDRRFGLKIATSRSGEPLGSALGRMGERFRGSRSCLVLFGSPSRGLYETFPELEKRTDFVVNLYPEQHVATVRTEEAVASALYLLELLGLPDTKV